MTREGRAPLGFATYLSVMVTLPCNSHGVDLAGVVFELDAATVVEVNGRAAVAQCGRLTIRLPRPTSVEKDTSSQTAGRKDVSMRRSFLDVSFFSVSTESNVSLSLCHRSHRLSDIAILRVLAHLVAEASPRQQAQP